MLKFVKPPKGVPWKAHITGNNVDISITNDDFTVIGFSWIAFEESQKKGEKRFWKTYYYKRSYRRRMYVSGYESGSMIQIALTDERKMDQLYAWSHYQGTNHPIARRERPVARRIVNLTKQEYEVILFLALKYFGKHMKKVRDPLAF